MKASLSIICTAIASVACACGALKVTPEEKALCETAVQEGLDNRSFHIDVDMMYPLRGTSKHVTTQSLKVKDDMLYSCLPYFGAVCNVPYGGGKGLNFEAAITGYADTRPKADRRVICLTTHNEEDHYIYTITVFNNGKADIDVRCRNREPIRFSGKVNTDARYRK